MAQISARWVVLLISTRHLHNFPFGIDVFDVDMCTEASDKINLFEGSRLSNLVLGSCSAAGIFALLLAVLVTSLNEKRKEEAVAGQPSLK